jgi:molybdenum cofactor cytidylyltransferase
MTGLIILAAGPSSRLGQPKQKLFYQGKSLLQHAVEEGILSGCSPVLVVLGAHESSVQEELNFSGIEVVSNDDWERGMSSSIKCGVESLLGNAPQVNQLIIMVCDQPYVEAEVLKKLIQAKEGSDKSIVACAYGDTLGTPVLFDRSFFPELLALQGEGGAKKLILDNKHQIVSIDFPLGSIDIDTLADYQKLTEGRNK